MNNDLITISLTVTPEQLRRITNILAPSPQAKYNRKVREQETPISEAQPSSKPASSSKKKPAGGRVTESEQLDIEKEVASVNGSGRVARFVRYTNLGGKQITRRVDGTPEELEADMVRNKHLSPEWVSGPYSKDEAVMAAMQFHMEVDPTNSWRV